MIVPGSVNPLLLASAAAAGGLQVSRSLRFNPGDSAYLNRTPASAGNRKTWTWAGWVKRGNLSDTYLVLFSAGPASSGARLAFTLYGNRLNLNFYGSGEILVTDQVLRDPGAWYHIVLAFDSTQSTAVDRAKVYVNGSRVTAFSTSPSITQNADYPVNGAVLHEIGRFSSGEGYYFDGYLANIHLIDGQQLTPSSFTETDATTGQLIPKTYSGSYGTNGFNLLFADNSSNTASTLGKDTSGNGNNWTPNNFSVDGVIRNYSSNVTTVATSVYSGTPATMFNGGTSIYYGVTSSSGNSSISIDLTGKSVSVSSSIRVYASFRTGQIWQINGSTVSSSGVAHPNTGWQTLSGWSAGAITSFSNSVPSGNANEIYAIEIDGVILTNNTGAGNDSLVDSPTNYGTDTGVGGEVRGNYCTLNPLDLTLGNGASITNGNLDAILANATIRGTIAIPSSGKWYYELTISQLYISSYGGSIGIVKLGTTSWSGAFMIVPGWDDASAGIYKNASKIALATGVSIGDVFGVAVNMDSLTLQIYRNNSVFGSAVSLDSAIYTPYLAGNGTSTGAATGGYINFGQRPFAYTAPSGFKALCTQNLPAPLVTKSNTVFDVVTYTGNSTNRNITGLAFSPDLVWTKCRSSALDNKLQDIVRGATAGLISNSTGAETTDTNGLLSFNSDGYSLGIGNVYNGSGDSYVGWAWDAGTSTVSNTQGSITSQVRANATAGFSVVTYTGSATANSTIGHGLGVAPGFIITKQRNGSNAWYCYHSALGTGSYIELSSTSAAGSLSNYWGTVSSTVFGQGYAAAGPNNGTQVAYCFAPVVGYSNGFSYTGNGSTDGVFVYLGMRPKLLLIKRTDTTGNWYLWDTVRNTYNVVGEELYPNLSSAAATATDLDILSNGFKMRSTAADFNASGGTYVGFAWAESPFNYSRAR